VLGESFGAKIPADEKAGKFTLCSTVFFPQIPNTDD
jgi:hypothetical protein